MHDQTGKGRQISYTTMLCFATCHTVLTGVVLSLVHGYGKGLTDSNIQSLHADKICEYKILHFWAKHQYYLQKQPPQGN